MPNVKMVHTDHAPKAAGPYSQAVVTQGLIFCSGQIGLDPKTMKLEEGMEHQIRRVMANLKEVLRAAGSDFEHVLKTTIFVTDMEDYPLVNEIYGGYFPVHKPARATVAVNRLPMGARVEIEMVAVAINR